MVDRLQGQRGGEDSRVTGGYRLIPVADLCRAWLGYREKRIRLMDLRVWFACQELLARRCTLEEGRPAHCTLEELHRLVGGVGGEHLRRALKRLADCDLLHWSAGRIDCPPSPGTAPAASSGALGLMLEKITNHRRRVPVPRRMLRWLARRASRALVATVLGHLLRCLYFRRGACSTSGACKASWVASVFGVHERRVKAARKELVALGWLTPLPCAQWYQNRFGRRVEINRRWAEWRPAAASRQPFSTTETPRLARRSTTETPPPESNGKLLAEYKNQEPAARGPAGVDRSNGVRGGGPPKLTNVSRDDLRDTGRLLELFRQAVAAGLLGGSEYEALQFAAAAEHALAVGRRNPAGLFAHLVRNGCWQFASQADEDAARRRLKRIGGAAVQEQERAPGVGIGRGEGPGRPEIVECVRRVLGSWALRRPAGATRFAPCIHEPPRPYLRAAHEMTPLVEVRYGARREGFASWSSATSEDAVTDALG